MEKETVIFFAAHNDDHVIGGGGTIAKYAKEGKRVIAVIFAYGEKTHPWLKEKVVIKMRVSESQKADKILGSAKNFYLGLKEGMFSEEIKKKKVEKKIMRIIRIMKPEKIFTHSPDDPHPDHRAVYSAIDSIIKKTNLKCDMYAFDIWNPLNIRKRNSPKLVVDVTKTFQLKIKAFKLHESQWLTMITMIPAIYIRAILNGLDKGVRYAEVFTKLR